MSCLSCCVVGLLAVLCGGTSDIGNETETETSQISDVNTSFSLTAEQKYLMNNYDNPETFVNEEPEMISPDDEVTIQQTILKQMYMETNGIRWTKNWNFANKNNLCNEYGITCDLNNFVTKIDLSFNNLKGILPDSLANITSLMEINFSNNMLTGDVKIFENLLLLTDIDISNNLFYGTLPSNLFLYNSNLRYFNIQNNNVSGSIPQTFGVQRNILEFKASWNDLSGFLPELIGNQLFLRIFDVSHNNIEGKIPDSLQDNDELEVLMLSHNNFLTEIPSVLSELINLRILTLNNNEFYGDLPDLTDLKYLEILWLKNNYLSGNISTIIDGSKKHLQDVRLKGNFFDCKLYNTWNVIATDSPTDITECVSKLWRNPATNIQYNFPNSLP